jgi:hypothetical protein
MKTKTKRTQVAAALKKKILQYYRHLNAGNFHWCYRAIDPPIRSQSTSVTYFQFASSLERFLNHYGGVRVKSTGIEVQLHQDEPNSLYQNRDFAVVKVLWQDKADKMHLFHERWVRNGRSWFSRCTGLITPEE